MLNDSSLQMNSAKTGKSALELRLHNVSQCVLPGNSKDEVEIQFYDNDAENQEEDCLVQIRMRFPGAGPDEEDEETPAQIFQQRIMERGMIHSVTGDVIAEFSEEQGTFITPRGRYAMQMYSTFMRMHGAKYDYRSRMRTLVQSIFCTVPMRSAPPSSSRWRSPFARATRSTPSSCYRVTAWSTPCR